MIIIKKNFQGAHNSLMNYNITFYILCALTLHEEIIGHWKTKSFNFDVIW